MPNALNAPTQFIDTATARFAYRRFGDPSSPPLVCTQHFMGNLDNFDPLISDRLADRRELVLFDNAGVGRSTGTAATTIPGLAAAAITFVDALGLTRIDLLGHSMGGEVAQIIALERPDLVRRLVLVGTGPRGGDGMAQRDPAVATLFTKRAELGDGMWLPIMFAPTLTSQAAGRAWLQRISARQDDRDTPVSDATIGAWRSAASDWGQPANGFGYLNDIHQPTLVVNGDHDIVIATINSTTSTKTSPTHNCGYSPTPTTDHTSNTRSASPGESSTSSTSNPLKTPPPPTVTRFSTSNPEVQVLPGRPPRLRGNGAASDSS